MSFPRFQLSLRLGELVRCLSEVAGDRVDARLARLFLDLAERHGEPAAGGAVRIALPLSRHEAPQAPHPSTTCHFQNSFRQSLAGDLEARQLFGDLAEIVLRQFELDRTEVLVEAVQFGRPWNRYDPRLLREQPGFGLIPVTIFICVNIVDKRQPIG